MNRKTVREWVLDTDVTADGYWYVLLDFGPYRLLAGKRDGRWRVRIDAEAREGGSV
jgi:hypothetical protein